MWVLDSVFLRGFWVIVVSILLLAYCCNRCCGPGILFIVIALLNYLSVYSDYHGFKEEKQERCGFLIKPAGL